MGMSKMSTEPVEVRPTHLHRQTGQVLHELTGDRRPRLIVNAYGRVLAVVLHPDDPRLQS
jgi:hypothetical protein